MKGLVKIVLFATAAMSFAACGGAANNSPASNSNAYSNANATKPTAAAPTTDTFLPMEKQANEAYIKGDSKFFEGFLSDKFVGVGGGQRTDKAAVVKMVGSIKCNIKDGWKLDEPQMSMIDADTYAFSYKSNMEGTCTADGHTEKMDKPIRAASVYIRNGDKWTAVFHGENVIVDLKALPPAKTDTKKPEPKKKEAKKDDKSASNSNAAAPAKSANTDALMAAEKSAWEAWKDHDTKKLEGLLSKDVSFVNIFGTYFANKADAIKDWSGSNCEAKSVSLTDGVGISISPTVGILTVTGSADGTCGGKDISGQRIYGTSVYVKDGDAWKWAFGFNSTA